MKKDVNWKLAGGTEIIIKFADKSSSLSDLPSLRGSPSKPILRAVKYISANIECYLIDNTATFTKHHEFHLFHQSYHCHPCLPIASIRGCL